MRNAPTARLSARAAITLSLYAIIAVGLVGGPAMQLGHADATLPASAEDVVPLDVGDRVPAFVVRGVDSEPWTFDADRLERPTVIITFRGGWCPYCNVHLSELRNVMPEIAGLGADVIFLSGDRPELLYSSLRADTQEAIDGLDYRIYSDADARAAIALGIAFRAAEATVQRRHEKGEDIADSSMERHGILPVPAVFVVGPGGTIVYRFVEADYKIRLPADDLLAAVRANIN